MSYPSPTELLPHRLPMLLVEAVLDHGEDEVRCRGRIQTDGPLVVAGRALVVAGVELGAQTAGVLAGLTAIEEGGRPATAGYLVGLRGVTFHVPDLPAGDPLEVVVRRTAGAGTLGIFAFEVHHPDGGELLVEGCISVMSA